MGFKLQPEENRRRSLTQSIHRRGGYYNRAFFILPRNGINFRHMKRCLNIWCELSFVPVCIVKTIHIACIVKSSCSCASVFSQQWSPTDSLAFHRESSGI